MSITLHKNVSILEADQDAIVNPANSFLNHAGGLARIIADAATPLGHSTSWYAQQTGVQVPTGGCWVGEAGALPQKAIIHAVGPIWGGGQYFEPQLLRQAHLECLRAVCDHDWDSIAFPAISCGVFGYPVRDAAYTAIDACWTPLGDTIDVHFYLMGDEHYDAFDAALRARVPPMYR